MMKIRNSAISLLLSVCLCCTPMPVHAAERDGTQDGDSLTWSFDSSDGTLTVAGTGDMADYDQYFYYEGCDDDWDNPKSWGINAPPWYRLREQVKRVCIAEGITGIGNNAFYCFEQLSEIEFPQTLQKIGDGVFEGCPELQAVSLPDSLCEIGSSAFCCTYLQQITVPGSVRTLGNNCFSDNDALTAVELQEGLKKIGDRCFSYCPCLTEISFPSSVETVGEDLMQNDTAWLQKQQGTDFIMIGSGNLYRYYGDSSDVVIPESVTNIDRKCFFKPYFYSYEEEILYISSEEEMRDDICSVTLPDTLTELPEGLFEGCYGLRTLHIGAAVTEIPASLCSGCDLLETVDLPDGLEAIGESAFYGCTALTSLQVPETVEHIGLYAFHQTPFLKQFGDWAVCGSGILLKYSGNDRVVTVPDGVRTICTNAFYGSNAVSVALSPTVRNLETNSFRSNMLTELKLNEGLTVLPAQVLDCTENFLYLTIPPSVTEIDPSCCRPSMAFEVTGEPGSAAEAFAEAKQLPFKDITAEPSGKDMTLDFEKDCWSFKNNSSTFSNENYLTASDRELLEENGLSAEKAWGGACFGMSVTVILAKNGLFSAEQITGVPSSIGDLQAGPEVQSMLNYYQCLQQTDEFRYGGGSAFYEQRIFTMIREAEAVKYGASPFMICIETEKGNRHAVVGYGTETGSWTYNGREWNHRIKVYDPNKAQFLDACCLYYDPVTLSVCVPAYGYYWDGIETGNGLYLRWCNNLHALNACPYPFAERFSPSRILGDLNGDGTLTADDAERLLDYLLCKAELSAAQMQQADLTGDGRLTAADLSRLKQKLLTGRQQQKAA